MSSVPRIARAIPHGPITRPETGLAVVARLRWAAGGAGYLLAYPVEVEISVENVEQFARACLESTVLEEACGTQLIDPFELMQQVARVHQTPLVIRRGIAVPAQILALTPPPPSRLSSN